MDINVAPILSNLPEVFKYVHQVLVKGGQLVNGNFYAVSYDTSESEEGAGNQALQWRPVTNLQVYDLLCCTIASYKPGDVMMYWQSVSTKIISGFHGIRCTETCTTVFLFYCIQHNLRSYKRLVFCNYLDQQPPYELPEGRNVPSEVPQLLPEIESIEIHCYDKENCIMVSGQGLWFARDLKLDRTQVFYTHPKENTNLQFQVTNTGDLEWTAEELPDMMKAQLGNCLSNYVTKQLPVTVKVR